MSKLSSIELIKRIKPELSSLSISNATITMDVNDVARLKVEFIVTDELIVKLMKNKEHKTTVKIGDLSIDDVEFEEDRQLPDTPKKPQRPKRRIISDDKRNQLIDHEARSNE